MIPFEIMCPLTEPRKGRVIVKRDNHGKIVRSKVPVTV